MTNLLISFNGEEFYMETSGNYMQCSFKYFEQCISANELVMPICLSIMLFTYKSMHSHELQSVVIKRLWHVTLFLFNISVNMLLSN